MRAEHSSSTVLTSRLGIGNTRAVDMNSAYAEALATYNASLSADSPFRLSDDPLKRLQLKKLVERVPFAGHVLDVGTGEGLIPHALHLLGYSVFSIESPKVSGAQRIERIVRLGIAGAYAEVGVDKLPLERESFDAVFMGDVIEHLPNSPHPFLRDLVDVLRPGGSVVLSTPNATRLTVRAKVLLGFSNWPSIEDYFDEDVHGGHHKEYTADELRLVLERVALTEVAVGYAENRIMTAPCARIGDIRTQNRSGVEFERPLGVRNAMIQAARRSGMALVRLAPQLASVLIATARKPEGPTAASE